jgi:hypothetical protein
MFFFIINQRTVLFSLAFQRNEQGHVCVQSAHHISIKSGLDPFRPKSYLKPSSYTRNDILKVKDLDGPLYQVEWPSLNFRRNKTTPRWKDEASYSLVHDKAEALVTTRHNNRLFIVIDSVDTEMV